MAIAGTFGNVFTMHLFWVYYPVQGCIIDKPAGRLILK